MVNRTKWIAPLLACGAALGCSAEQTDEIGVAQSALSVCDETVPDERFIDGIPAYAQCSASQSTAIYSNNGVDTSTTKVDDTWVRTQWSGGYQCTELAHRYLYFIWDVDWIPNGNAGFWCDDPPPANSGIVQTMEPVHGDIMVLPPGSCGASPSTGHVTVVDIADGSDRLSVVEQNGARRGSYQKSCAQCFLHVVANDGTTGGAGVPAPTTAGMGAEAGTTAPDPMEPEPQQPDPMEPTPDPMMAEPSPTQPTPAAPTNPPLVPAAPPPDVTPAPAGANGGTAGADSPLPTVPSNSAQAEQLEAEGCSVTTQDTRGAWLSTLLWAAALLPFARRRRS